MSVQVSPITIDNFDAKCVTIGKCSNFPTYGFKKYAIGYSRPNVIDDNCFFKLSKVKVSNIFAPAPDAKNPQYNVSFLIEDESQITALDRIQNIFKTLAGKNTGPWFGDENLTYDDISGEFKPFAKLADKNNKYYLSLKVSYNNPKDSVKIVYYDTSVSDEIKASTDLIAKLPRGTEVDVFVNLTDVKIDKTGKFDVQAKAFQQINVHQFSSGAGSGSGGKSGPNTYGMPLESVVPQKIVMGDVVEGKLPNGAVTRCLKPKYALDDAKDGKSTRSFSIQLNGVKLKFLAIKNKDSNKVNYNAVFTPDEKQLAKFRDIEQYMIDDMIKNYSKYGLGNKVTMPVFKKKWNSVVNDKKPEYGINIWFPVYVRTYDDKGNTLLDESGNQVYDFGEHFFRSDKTKYTNEDVLNKIFNGKDVRCDVNIYFKHLWFSDKGFSPSFAMGDVVLDVDNIKYDLGAEVADSEPTQQHADAEEEEEGQEEDGEYNEDEVPPSDGEDQ